MATAAATGCMPWYVSTAPATIAVCARQPTWWESTPKHHSAPRTAKRIACRDPTATHASNSTHVGPKPLRLATLALKASGVKTSNNAATRPRSLALDSLQCSHCSRAESFALEARADTFVLDARTIRHARAAMETAVAGPNLRPESTTGDIACARPMAMPTIRAEAIPSSVAKALPSRRCDPVRAGAPCEAQGRASAGAPEA